MANNTHGGARTGAGRPKGVPNRLPSKARAAQEALITKLEPHLDLVVQTAVALLQDPNVKADTKVATIKTLLDFIQRGASQEAAEAVIDAVGGATVSDLLRLKEQAAGGASVEGE